jgi:small conductance mechanosensitive channel
MIPFVDPTPAIIADTPCYVGAQSKGTLCRWVYDNLGHNQTLAESSDWLIAKPARVLVILLIAWIVRKIVHRAIARMCKRLADGVPHPGFVRGRNGNDSSAETSTGTAGALPTGTLATERRRQRAATVSSVLESVSTGVIFAVAILMALAEVGANIAPLIASAGIIGVAVGFGAQSLVKDFLSGVFMVIEDQYGVGDVTDLGDATGTVESVGLRVTRLRDINGTVWYVRNGEILRVGNKSQGWARAVVDIDVAYDEDIARVRTLLMDAANELFAQPENRKLIIEEPEIWGVEALSADAVVIRLVVKTVPLQQWKVARMLREAIKGQFDRNDVEIPFPQRTVWVRSEDDDEAARALTASVSTVGENPPRPTKSESSGKGEPPGRRSGDPLDR